MDHQIRAWWVARKLPGIIRQIPIGVLVVSVTGKIVYANPYVFETTGITDKELLGFQIDTLRYEPSCTLAANLYRSISLGEPWQGETQIREKSGGTFHVLESIYPLRESDGSMTHFVHFLQDISGPKLSEAIFRLAFYDTLTGLPNRNLFNDRLSHALTNAQRNQTGFAVMYIDVDNFKQVNDTLGHEAGDTVLREIASHLSKHLRESDTLARVGGDEFIAILESTNEPDTLGRIAAKLLAACARSQSIQAYGRSVSVSIGISCYPNDAHEPEALLRLADEAMYRAKAKGKNAYCLWDRSLIPDKVNSPGSQ